jgi:dTDP-4-amino-4,6-dideoxygalactose transaminase
MRLFVNKAWPYGEANPDHEFLAPNYRLSELAGAVGLAQLAKLADGVAARRGNADRLTAALDGVPGVATPPPVADGDPSWWRYPIHVDRRVVAGGAPALGAALADLGVPSAPRYIQKPAFQCRVFTERRTFGASQWPFTLARPEALDWSPERYPGTFAYLDSVLVLPWNERYTDEHVDHLAGAIRAAVRTLREAA